MNIFVNQFWNWYVILLVLGSVLICGVFLWSQSIHHPGGEQTSDTTGHVWDESLEEYNNPLPRWWMWLFYITIVFALVYALLYPTLGSFQGLLGWSSSRPVQAGSCTGGCPGQSAVRKVPEDGSEDRRCRQGGDGNERPSLPDLLHAVSWRDGSGFKRQGLSEPHRQGLAVGWRTGPDCRNDHRRTHGHDAGLWRQPGRHRW